MTESLVNSDDVLYFAKRLSEVVSQHEINEVVGQVKGQVALTVKDAGSFFLPTPPPLALGAIEVDYDGQNNRILACHESSPDATPEDADVVATVPQPVKKRSAHLTSTTPPHPKRVRSKGFWKKNRATSTSIATF